MEDTEKIRQKIDIVDFISEHVLLKKTGRNFKANCPFHNEKTPSFVVSPERQIWHCFGCGKGGDIFGFLMEYEKIEFSESLKYLADRAGIKLSGGVFRSENSSKRELIYSINHISANFYNYLLLNHPVGKKALSYLVGKRKLSEKLIKTFNLGFAPYRNDSLVNYLTKKKNFKEQDIIDAGLAFSGRGGTIDFFKDRVIFPIHDVRDNIIAFAGRILNGNNSSGPKYINTKETIVYKKGETLFGLNLARDEIKKENQAIVVEGEFDLISCFKEGIKNVVAVKGTALTEMQIKLLKRYAEKISFCFDTDKAGEEAQRRSIALIEKFNVLASVIVPPEGKDPDELINENPLLFKKAIKKDVNIYDFIIDSAAKDTDNKTIEGKRKILEKTLSFLVLIENEVIKEHYYKKISKILDSSVESIQRQAEKILSKKVFSTPSSITLNQLPREHLIEPYLLSLILQAKNPKEFFLLSKDIIDNTELTVLVFQKIYSHLDSFFLEQNEFLLDKFANTLPPELLETFNKCYLAPVPEFADREKLENEIRKISIEIKSLSLKNRIKKIGEQIKEKEKEGKAEELKTLHEEFNKLTQAITR